MTSYTTIGYAISQSDSARPKFGGCSAIGYLRNTKVSPDPDGQANVYDRSREKAILEKQNNALDKAGELVEDCENRLIFDARNLVESYVNGYLKIALEIASRRITQEYRVRVEADPSRGFEQMGLGTNSLHFELPLPTLSESSYRDERLVFISPSEFVEGPQKAIPSLVRLQAPNEVSRLGAKPLYFSLGGRKFKFLLGSCKGEICSRDVAGTVSGSEATGKMIECRTKIVDSITGDDSHVGRDSGCQPDLERFTRAARIDFLGGGDRIRWRLKEGFDSSLYLKDMLIGPFNL